MSVPSAGVGSAHPLRQTSFPPEEGADVMTPFSARSPSIDMDATSIKCALMMPNGLFTLRTPDAQFAFIAVRDDRR